MEKEDCTINNIKVDGLMASGKQYDLEIMLPEDDREVVYGVVLDKTGRPVENAIVKLVEVIRISSDDVRAPVTHTFTNKNGEFTFGPLCPDRDYEILIWANEVTHKKVCIKPEKDFECLEGRLLPKCEFKNCKDNICCEEKSDCDYDC